jgi:DNA-binding SARP family transcriptional activator
VTAGTLRIVLLGGRIAIHRDGVPVASLSGRRPELVVAYLAAEHRRSVSRDELADALWPQTLPGDRAGALKAYEHCRALLASELHIEPSPETEEALRRALQGRTPAAAEVGEARGRGRSAGVAVR